MPRNVLNVYELFSRVDSKSGIIGPNKTFLDVINFPTDLFSQNRFLNNLDSINLYTFRSKLEVSERIATGVLKSDLVDKLKETPRMTLALSKHPHAWKSESELNYDMKKIENMPYYMKVLDNVKVTVSSSSRFYDVRLNQMNEVLEQMNLIREKINEVPVKVLSSEMVTKFVESSIHHLVNKPFSSSVVNAELTDLYNNIYSK